MRRSVPHRKPTFERVEGPLMSSTSPSPAPTPPTQRSWKSAGIVLAIIFMLSVALATVLYLRYRSFFVYIHQTLTHPVSPPPWIADGPLSPEGCVDVAMAWATDCPGIKNLCDEYTNKVIEECMAQGDHSTYCYEIEDLTSKASFGAEECLSRGARRHMESESCGKAYTAIGGYCAWLRDNDRIDQGLEPLGPKAWQRKQRGERYE